MDSFREYILLHCPETEGSVYLDHVGCPSGEDRKHRLFVTRTSEGKVLWYCHHCGGRGVTSGKSFGGVGIARNVATLLTDDELVWSPVSWPPEARGWLAKYDVTPDMAGAAYHVESGRLMLPVKSFLGTTVGQQLRAVLLGMVPKYLSKGVVNHGSWHRDGDVDSSTVVVVEDILSAIRVQKFLPAVALLRTSISSNIVSDILDAGYTRVVIWLDDDDAGRHASPKIVRTLIPLLDVDKITMQQAKACTDDEIERTLDSAALASD
jgi:hypothetical protein